MTLFVTPEGAHPMTLYSNPTLSPIADTPPLSSDADTRTR
jgi:hypothetical protein